jgi:hypothetical protein
MHWGSPAPKRTETESGPCVACRGEGNQIAAANGLEDPARLDDDGLARAVDALGIPTCSSSIRAGSRDLSRTRRPMAASARQRPPAPTCLAARSTGRPAKATTPGPRGIATPLSPSPALPDLSVAAGQSRASSEGESASIVGSRGDGNESRTFKPPAPHVTRARWIDWAASRPRLQPCERSPWDARRQSDAVSSPGLAMAPRRFLERERSGPFLAPSPSLADAPVVEADELEYAG